MTQKIKIYEDGKQLLVEGDMNINLNNHGEAEEYEVDITKKEFQEMMGSPQDVKVKRIKNKRLIKRVKIRQNPPRS